MSLQFINQLFHPEQQTKKTAYSDLERYHAEIFEYYTRLAGFKLAEDQSERIDKLLRSSRNIMNATKNIYELKDELYILRREIAPELQRAYQSISKRIDKIFNEGSRLKDGADISGDLDELQQFINREDRDFIKMCGEIISSGDFKKVEVTFLLMLNRVITQSGRMLFFAMQNLQKLPEPEDEKSG